MLVAICLRLSRYNTAVPVPRGVVIPYSANSKAEYCLVFSITSHLLSPLLSTQSFDPRPSNAVFWSSNSAYVANLTVVKIPTTADVLSSSSGTSVDDGATIMVLRVTAVILKNPLRFNTYVMPTMSPTDKLCSLSNVSSISVSDNFSTLLIFKANSSL